MKDLKEPVSFRKIYPSPLGTVLLTADEAGLTGLWFLDEEKPQMDAVPEAVFAAHPQTNPEVHPAAHPAAHSQSHPEKDPALSVPVPFLDEASVWLDAYFAGKRDLPAAPKLHLMGSPFQLLIWSYLKDIPYGKVVTYGNLAKRAAADLGKKKMSAQAVGGAVGKNPVSLILPCHRVVGAGGRMVGYGGGLWRKEYLLKLENCL